MLKTSPTHDIPLVLDLDGTLIHTDTCHHMTLLLLFKKPWLVPFILYWLIRNRPYGKAKLATWVSFYPERLRYNQQLLEFAQNEAKKGRMLILATGTDQLVAEKIATHLGIFHEVIGSNGIINMTGHNKKQALLERFNVGGFDYAGDAPIDLYVWEVSRKAIVVRPKRGVIERVQSLKSAEHIHYFLA